MQQFEVSVFYVVVRWHKLGEVDSECTSHNFIVSAIHLPKIINDLMKFWQKQFGPFFGPPCICKVHTAKHNNNNISLGKSNQAARKGTGPSKLATQKSNKENAIHAEDRNDWPCLCINAKPFITCIVMFLTVDSGNSFPLPNHIDSMKT